MRGVVGIGIERLKRIQSKIIFESFSKQHVSSILLFKGTVDLFSRDFIKKSIHFITLKIDFFLTVISL